MRYRILIVRIGSKAAYIPQQRKGFFGRWKDILDYPLHYYNSAVRTLSDMGVDMDKVKTKIVQGALQ